MIYGSTPAPLLLIILWLIDCGECFCLVHGDETCLKLYLWNIIHPTLPCKYVLVNLLFYHCLIVECFQSFYILLLIVWIVFLALSVSDCNNFLKVGVVLISIKPNTRFQYVSNPKMDIPTTQEILLFRLMLYDIVMFFGATVCYHIVHWFFCVSNICSDS